jgi:uncharacterized DUF497 family protein
MTEDEDTIRRLFAGIRSFDWYPEKAALNLRDHGIDFVDAKRVFDGPTFIRRSDRYGQVRYQVFGTIEGREVAVACTVEGGLCWIISARRARRDERRKFYAGLAR